MSTAEGGGNIVTDGLVLYLDAANTRSYPGTGTTWSDLSRSGNNGTLINGPAFNSANGGSIVFDGVDDYVNVSINSPIPTGSSPRTLCSFFNVTSLGGGRVIFGFGSNTVQGSRTSLWVDSSNRIGVETLNCATWTTNWTGINTWVYLCAVLPNGSNTVGSFKIYVNGVEKITTSLNGSQVINSTNSQIVVGTIPESTGSNLFLGKIPIVKIYNRDLSAAEVLQNYNATKSRFGL